MYKYFIFNSDYTTQVGDSFDSENEAKDKAAKLSVESREKIIVAKGTEDGMNLVEWITVYPNRIRLGMFKVFPNPYYSAATIKENLMHCHVMHNDADGRTWLGTVKGAYEKEGIVFLSVYHFNGEPWPFDPKYMEIQEI